MKIELKSREGSVYKKLCNSVSEANSDTELIVPDSLEDILRILSCRRQCRIREKNVGQDAVSVSGEIDVTVMYIPETGDGVRVVGTTIPFEINFSAPGADSTSSAVTKLLALNADAKAVNPRKILISTSTVMELSCYKYSDVGSSLPRTRRISCISKQASLNAKALYSFPKKRSALRMSWMSPNSSAVGIL